MHCVDYAAEIIKAFCIHIEILTLINKQCTLSASVGLELKQAREREGKRDRGREGGRERE